MKQKEDQLKIVSDLRQKLKMQECRVEDQLKVIQQLQKFKYENKGLMSVNQQLQSQIRESEVSIKEVLSSLGHVVSDGSQEYLDKLQSIFDKVPSKASRFALKVWRELGPINIREWIQDHGLVMDYSVATEQGLKNNNIVYTGQVKDHLQVGFGRSEYKDRI
jgi:hypothetical protein